MVLLLLLTASLASGENWPAWRGADGLGISREKSVPSGWSRTENVRWRFELPEPGNSTPIVWGDSIFLTQPRAQKGLRSVMCIDRRTGKLRWEASLEWHQPEPTHKTNPFASASPATDGERVIAWFGSAGVIAFDMQGKRLWHRDLGIQRHTWGYASTPVIYREWVYLHFGPGDRNFLIALDKRTGKTVWQVDIPAGEGVKFSNWEPKDMYGSWSTPLVHNGKLIVTHPHKVTEYDPATGKAMWSTDGLGDLVYPSPIIGEGVLIAASGFGGPSMGLTVTGEKLWRLEKSKPQIGSGVIHDGHLYVIDIQGIAHCLKLRTGETVWSQRLNAGSEDNGVWSSPVFHNGRILVMNKSGQTFVYQARPQFELLGVHSLNEPSNSSVVISGGEIFLRTHQALWCISERHN
jgi:outer membrane protein assembly factor BamB